LYCGNGGFLYKNTPHEVANQIEVTTRRGVERCIRYAFEYAKRFNRKKVTLVAKTNVLRFAHNLWLRAFEDVKSEYPGIETDYHHVDACTMYMVTKPKMYDVIVTTNMFGDIITDLGAAIQGGMGMAASGNLNPTRQAASMFEPVHGSAPDIAGKNFANPIATFLSVAMMLDFLNQPKAAAGHQRRLPRRRRRSEKSHPRSRRDRDDRSKSTSRAISLRRSLRCTTKSMNPCSSRNSLR
jgi:3-isopropylmalate dehydrogenase